MPWIKIAHQAGIGRSAVRLVATDGSGCMDPNALKEAIIGDRIGGCVPIMIVATAGTTNAGMIDPLSACAELACSNSLWYHVDAAWGGALIASERMRHFLNGIERADSVTIDAHKWFATTMGCGMFITRHPHVLSSAFHVWTSFMPSNNASIDPYVTSVQWSRRFLGLRMFISLAAAGWTGYADHVERSVELAEMLKAELLRREWSVVNSSPLGVLCIQPPPSSGDVRAIVARVLASGRVWVAVASFEGSEIIRTCVTHGETTGRRLQLARTLYLTVKAVRMSLSPAMKTINDQEARKQRIFVEADDFAILRHPYLLVILIPVYRDEMGALWLERAGTKISVQHLSYITDLRLCAPVLPKGDQPDLIRIDLPSEAGLRVLALPAHLSKLEHCARFPKQYLRSGVLSEKRHCPLGSYWMTLPFGWIANPLTVLRRKALVIIIESSWLRGDPRRKDWRLTIFDAVSDSDGSLVVQAC